MSKGRDRTVYQRSDGQWANKRNDSGRASSLHDTQGSARRATCCTVRMGANSPRSGATGLFGARTRSL